jgi:CubicO group peptidase (beta-lactamase class C family)
MQQDSILAIASCTKLMTSIAALQCVERGLLNLDENIHGMLPEAVKFGIITGFGEVKNEAVLVLRKNATTLR